MVRIEIKILLEQSKADFRTAKNSFKSKDYYASVFWCQQAIEKSLKAIFIYKKSKSAGHTPSLIYLAKEIKLPDKFSEILRELAPEFITTRYPDVAGDAPYKLYSKNKTNFYLKKSSEVLKWLENQIKKH